MLWKKYNQRNESYLQQRIDKLNGILKKREIHDLIYILGSKKEIFRRNILAGLARGIGSGIGFTVITAVIIYFLQKIVRLNIPIIGEYINDIVEIVQSSK